MRVIRWYSESSNKCNIFDYKIRREDGNIEIQRFAKRSFKLRRWEDGIQAKIKTIDRRVGFFVTLRALKIIRLLVYYVVTLVYLELLLIHFDC